MAIQQTDTNIPIDPALLSVPLFWPLLATHKIAHDGLDLFVHHAKALHEGIRIFEILRPQVATPNETRLDLRTMTLRDYGTSRDHGQPSQLPTLVDAPYAGHSAAIADFREGQSLVTTLLDNGHSHVALTDWKSATDDMKDLEIDNYLADMVVAIDDLGGRVNLVGLCQGGWMSAMIAARFPEKVNSLVLAGSPIDTHAGDGPLKKMVQLAPPHFYEDLVAAGGGLMRGEMMLQGWKNMNPTQHYLREPADLLLHIDDPDYVKKTEIFATWYEHPLNLPGRWYLQAINQLFKENRFCKGEFVGLGRPLNLKNIVCPTFLLAGESDDITTKEQVLDAAKFIGTPKDKITSLIAPGGHIGLFMGSRTLKDTWPKIARWIAAQS
jgi:poly(3-hydroxyalkanoate) synthetase